jgi:ABC-2 type transport system ATP-binding protein
MSIGYSVPPYWGTSPDLVIPAGPMVSAVGLTKAFGSTAALAGVDLAVMPGTVMALLGPNGAGKTTAVRILSTLLRPDSGEVWVGGYDALREPQKVRSLIGIAGQSASIDEKLTGRDNLTMLGRLGRLSARDAQTRAHQLLEEFGLAEAADRAVKTYSGGMRRKLDLAASLVVSPPILFLDEPTTGLDPLSRDAMWETLRGLVGQGVTVLLTTQYLEEADRLADSITFLSEGRVVAVGSPQSLKAELGRRRLELVGRSDRDADSLRLVLGDLVVAGGEEDRRVSVALDEGEGSIRHLRDVLERIGPLAPAIESYELRQPTLDDVFRVVTSPSRVADLRPGL